MRKKIALVSLVIILGLVSWSILGKEKQLAAGKIVYLELRPVDPRSLVQGDYMALRFQLADEVYNNVHETEDTTPQRYDIGALDGFVIASLDERKRGSFKSIYDGQTLSENEILLRYRIRNGEVKFATNGFFFQEGHGEYYESAEYGQFRVDDKGELLLVDMYDSDLNKLEPKELHNSK